MMNPPKAADIRQSEEYAKYMKRLGWEVESMSYEVPSMKCEANAFIRKLPLIGSVVKIQRPEVIPPKEELDKLAKKHCALFIKVEPFDSAPPRKTLRVGDFKPEGLGNRRGSAQSRPPATRSFDPDTWPLLPTKTLYLDLRKPEEELWENLDQDARYSVRRGSRNLQIAVCELQNIDESKLAALKGFHLLLKKTGRSKGFHTQKWGDLRAKVECLGEKVWLVLARRKGTEGTKGSEGSKDMVAGCLFLIHDKVAYGHHAASSEEGRKLLAGYLVLWETIKLAKSLGCHTFDFEGIYDERFPKTTKNWKGFTYFKKKFGGREVEFPKPLIKYYSLPIKLLFQFFG